MKTDVKKSNAKIYVFPIILMIIMWVILFLPALSIKFWQAWIYYFLSDALAKNNYFIWSSLSRYTLSCMSIDNN